MERRGSPPGAAPPESPSSSAHSDTPARRSACNPLPRQPSAIARARPNRRRSRKAGCASPGRQPLEEAVPRRIDWVGGGHRHSPTASRKCAWGERRGSLLNSTRASQVSASFALSGLERIGTEKARSLRRCNVYGRGLGRWAGLEYAEAAVHGVGGGQVQPAQRREIRHAQQQPPAGRQRLVPSALPPRTGGASVNLSPD